MINEDLLKAVKRHVAQATYSLDIDRIEISPEYVHLWSGDNFVGLLTRSLYERMTSADD